MKIVLWVVFAVLAVLWTGGAAALAQLMQWSAAGLAGGADVAVSATVAMPGWLSGWVDPAAWAAAQQAATEATAAVRAALPALGTAVGWLVPAVWVVWGLGLAALLAATLAGQWAVGRLRRGAGPLATA